MSAHVTWKQDQPIVKYLKTWVPIIFPVVPRNHARGKGVGGFVDRTTAKGKFSAHSEGRAADIYLDAFDSTQKQVGDRLFYTFRSYGQLLGVDHVIWNREIWSSAKGGPRPFEGAGRRPHTDHVHVAFTREASQSQPPLLLLLLHTVSLQVYGTWVGL